MNTSPASLDGCPLPQSEDLHMGWGAAQPCKVWEAVCAKKAAMPVGNRDTAVYTVNLQAERRFTIMGAAAIISIVNSISHRGSIPDNNRISMAATPPSRTGRTSPPVAATATP